MLLKLHNIDSRGQCYKAFLALLQQLSAWPTLAIFLKHFTAVFYKWADWAKSLLLAGNSYLAYPKAYLSGAPSRLSPWKAPVVTYKDWTRLGRPRNIKKLGLKKFYNMLSTFYMLKFLFLASLSTLVKSLQVRPVPTQMQQGRLLGPMLDNKYRSNLLPF